MIDKENTFNCNYLQVIVEKSWEKNLSQDIKQNTDTASVFNAGFHIAVANYIPKQFSFSKITFVLI